MQRQRSGELALSINREKPDQRAEGNSITQECGAVVWILTHTLFVLSSPSAIPRLSLNICPHRLGKTFCVRCAGPTFAFGAFQLSFLLPCARVSASYLLRKAFPNAFSFLKGFLGSTTKAFPGMTPSVSPCITAMKESVVGSGPILIPGKSCSNR